MTNEERAELSKPALAAFVAAKYEISQDGDMPEDIADPVSDLMHLAKQRGHDPLEIIAHGIGMFTAEDAAEATEDGHEPAANDVVDIYVNGSRIMERDEANMLTSLKNAESFIAGFEGDAQQAGIDDLLADIRAIIANAEGRA